MQRIPTDFNQVEFQNNKLPEGDSTVLRGQCNMLEYTVYEKRTTNDHGFYFKLKFQREKRLVCTTDNIFEIYVSKTNFFISTHR